MRSRCLGRPALLGLTATIGLEKLDVVLMYANLGTAQRFLPHLLEAWESLDPPARSVAFSVALVGGFGRAPWGCSEDPVACGFSADDMLLPNRAAYVPVPMTTDTTRMSFWATNMLDRRMPSIYPTTANYTEGLVQIAAGTGYDVDCDGTFDERIDQPAWPPSPGDVFDGGATPAWDADLFSPVGEEGAVGFRTGSARLLYPVSPQLPVRCTGFYQPFREAPNDISPSLSHLFEGPELCRPYNTWEDAADALSEARAWVAFRSDVREPQSADACAMNPRVSGYDTLPALGYATGSVGDLDGDGAVEPYHVKAVPHLDGLFFEDNVRRTYREEARPLLADIRRRLDPDLVVPAVRSDPHGFVTSITPDQIVDPDYDDTVEVVLTLRGTVPPEEGDRAYLVDVALVGDGHWDMYTETVLVIVPGWTRF